MSSSNTYLDLFPSVLVDNQKYPDLAQQVLEHECSFSVEPIIPEWARADPSKQFTGDDLEELVRSVNAAHKATELKRPIIYRHLTKFNLTTVERELSRPNLDIDTHKNILTIVGKRIMVMTKRLASQNWSTKVTNLGSEVLGVQLGDCVFDSENGTKEPTDEDIQSLSNNRFKLRHGQEMLLKLFEDSADQKDQFHPLIQSFVYTTDSPSEVNFTEQQITSMDSAVKKALSNHMEFNHKKTKKSVCSKGCGFRTGYQPSPSSKNAYNSFETCEDIKATLETLKWSLQRTKLLLQGGWDGKNTQYLEEMRAKEVTEAGEAGEAGQAE